MSLPSIGRSAVPDGESLAKERHRMIARAPLDIARMGRIVNDILSRIKWLAGRALERATRESRNFVALLYLLLALLVGMQLASPGALERVASIEAGRWLLIGVAGLLLVCSALAFLHLVGPRADTLGGGTGDVLLHFSFALVALRLSVGNRPFTSSYGALLAGALGLLLAATGAWLISLSFVALRPRPTAALQERFDIMRRDRRIRGVVFAAVGAIFFDSALQSAPGAARLAGSSWGMILLGTVATALIAYAVQTLWLTHEEKRLLFS